MITFLPFVLEKYKFIIIIYMQYLKQITILQVHTYSHLLKENA